MTAASFNSGDYLWQLGFFLLVLLCFNTSTLYGNRTAPVTWVVPSVMVVPLMLGKCAGNNIYSSRAYRITGQHSGRDHPIRENSHTRSTVQNYSKIRMCRSDANLQVSRQGEIDCETAMIAR